MSNLRTLFPDTNWTVAISGETTLNKLYVYNTNTNSVSNGGQCCCWIVPTDVSWATFEVWGGGGGGGGACCCQSPYQNGGSGSYTRKTIAVSPGNWFTVCAGGTTNCATSCLGSVGFPSYACNATYGLCLCASGGGAGTTCCFHGFSGGYPSGPTVLCGSTCGGSFSLCGISGASRTGTCGFDSWHYTPSGPILGGGARASMDVCAATGSGCYLVSGSAFFPGGGGTGGIGNGGGCCWGGWGAGGLVAISYK